MFKQLDEHLGVKITYTPNGDDSLHFMRFNDLICTDILLKSNSGCIILIKNAEHILRSVDDGLLRFVKGMYAAGDEHANPMRYIHGVAAEYAKKPKSIHTILCYEEIPKNAPNANLIKLKK